MVWIDQKSIMNHEQTEDTKNNLDMKRDDRPDKTIASGIVTLQLRRAGPVLESMLLDTMMDLETMGADASTPVLGQNHRSGVRPKLLGAANPGT